MRVSNVFGAGALSLLLAAPAGAAEPGFRLANLTWIEAEAVLTRERVVVLPLGAAAKEHGPHLLLRNDQVLADYFARRVVEARPVALLPTLTYGFYPAFLEYPGSVSLAADTQRDVVAQIVRSIARYGPRRFYVLNTGVSTARPLAATVELLAAEGIAPARSRATRRRRRASSRRRGSSATRASRRGRRARRSSRGSWRMSWPRSTSWPGVLFGPARRARRSTPGAEERSGRGSGSPGFSSGRGLTPPMADTTNLSGRS